MTSTTDITLWPSNEFRVAARNFVAEQLPGTPAWALFPRWYTNRRVMFMESTSGGRLATLDMENGTVTFSDRLTHLPICGQTLQASDELKALAS